MGIESKLGDDCDLIIEIINDNVLNKSCDGEAKCFFVKMVGDYYRYKAENAKGGDRQSKAICPRLLQVSHGDHPPRMQSDQTRTCPQLLRVPLRGHEGPQVGCGSGRPGTLGCP